MPRRPDPQQTDPSDPAASGEAHKAKLRRQVEQWQNVHRMADAVSRADSLEGIYDAALDGLQGVLGVRRASILLFDRDGIMRFKAWRGLSESYRQALEGHTPWAPGQLGAESIVVGDVRSDPALENHRHAILEEGIRALAFIPLSSHGRVIGKFMLYYAEPRHLAADELQLAETLARYVANAVERKRTEVALEESEEEFRAIFEIAGSGAALLEPPRGRFLRVNPTFCEMLGYRAEELRERTLESVSHPDDYRQGSPERRRLMRGEIPVYSADTRLLRKDGSVLWGHVVATASRDAEGRPVRVLGVVQDISERKGAEQALRTSEARWRRLAELGSVLASSLDLERALESVTRLALPLFGDFSIIHLVDDQGELRVGAVSHVDREREPQLRELAEADQPEDSPQSYLVRAFREREPLVFEDPRELLRWATRGREAPPIAAVATSSSAPTSMLAAPLVARGRALGTLLLGTAAESGQRLGHEDLAIAQELARRAALAIDNTRLYHQLRESDRRKDEFLAMLAHELRNPLAAIVNAGELLRLRADDDAVRDLAIEMVGRQARHMARLVDDLLDVSRITRGAIPLRRRPLELGQLLRQAVAGARSLLDQRQQQLSVLLPSEPVWVEGDEARLEQVISNLLSNSSKFTPDGEAITAELEASSAEAILRVRDRGEGIDPEFLPRVFDLFAQEDRSLARSEGGLGIGLTLTRTLVELHDGSIAAHSQGRGHGSTFTVRLPRTGPAEIAEAPGGSARAEPASPLRILVVEDSPDSAKALAELLRLWRHEVVAVPDARTALNACQHFHPHVVLIDIGLPDLDGYELASRLQRQSSGEKPHLIALTGYGHEADRQRSREVGIAHHLVKPVDPSVLSELLRRAPRGTRP